MNQIQQQPNNCSDEISLIDVAKILVRRRRVFYVVFLGIAVIALLYALIFLGEAKEYTTLVQLGEKVEEGKSEPLERPATVIANFDSQWLPERRSSYAANNQSPMPFNVEAENPRDTNLIKLRSVSPQKNAEIVRSTHQHLVDKITERQNAIVEREKRVLSQRLSHVEAFLERVGNESGLGQAAAEAVQQRARIIAELESLQTPEVLTVGRESLENKGTSKLLVMVAAVFLGFILAIVATFTAEFIARVRLALEQPDGDA